MTDPIAAIRCQFKGFSTGGKETCRIGIGIEGGHGDLNERARLLCFRRLSVALTLAEAGEPLTGMEEEFEEAHVLRGFADTKGMQVKRDGIGTGLTFNLNDVDLVKLASLAGRAGRIEVFSSEEIPGKNCPEAPVEVGNGTTNHKWPAGAELLMTSDPDLRIEDVPGYFKDGKRELSRSELLAIEDQGLDTVAAVVEVSVNAGHDTLLEELEIEYNLATGTARSLIQAVEYACCMANTTGGKTCCECGSHRPRTVDECECGTRRFIPTFDDVSGSGEFNQPGHVALATDGVDVSLLIARSESLGTWHCGYEIKYKDQTLTELPMIEEGGKSKPDHVVEWLNGIIEELQKLGKGKVITDAIKVVSDAREDLLERAKLSVTPDDLAEVAEKFRATAEV